MKEKSPKLIIALLVAVVATVGLVILREPSTSNKSVDHTAKKSSVEQTVRVEGTKPRSPQNPRITNGAKSSSHLSDNPRNFKPTSRTDTPAAVFSRLFARLGIDAEKQNRIWEFLRKKDTAGILTREGIREKKFSSMQEAQDFYDLKCAEADVEIKSVLSDTEFAAFRETEEKLPVWSMENAYSDYLSAEGIALSDATRESLVDLIFKKYKTRGVNLTYDPDTSWVRGETFRTYLTQRQLADGDVLKVATTLLGEKEIVILRKYQEAQLVGFIYRWNQKHSKAGAKR